jgi:hypothetical protein
MVYPEITVIVAALLASQISIIRRTPKVCFGVLF